MRDLLRISGIGAQFLPFLGLWAALSIGLFALAVTGYAFTGALEDDAPMTVVFAVAVVSVSMAFVLPSGALPMIFGWVIGYILGNRLGLPGHLPYLVGAIGTSLGFAIAVALYNGRSLQWDMGGLALVFTAPPALLAGHLVYRSTDVTRGRAE